MMVRRHRFHSDLATISEDGEEEEDEEEKEGGGGSGAGGEWHGDALLHGHRHARKLAGVNEGRPPAAARWHV